LINLPSRVSLFLAGFVLALAPAARAAVKLPNILSDHAVLQRDAPIHVWGWADPGEAVSVTLHDQQRSATADRLGHWEIYFAPERAGGPYELRATATNTIVLSDILIGDVWFASGQSNMEMPLEGFPGNAVLNNADQEIKTADRPNIRLLHIGLKASNYPLPDQPATWTLCTPETAAGFSAVAYLFGREIEQREHKPVGLIDSTWGGTPAEAWISLDSISADASLMPIFAFWSALADRQPDTSALVAAEEREDAAAKQSGRPPAKHSWHPNLDSWRPSALFNAMVAPATPFAIKGVIWYQGETNSNVGRANLYQRVFSALISDWRLQWQQGNFPFLYVQISSFTSDHTESWGTLRDQQRRTLDLVNTAMAVTLDIGDPDNVHPSDKQTVAARLALAARALAYGETLEYSGPLFRQATVDGAGMRVWFDHTDGKLVSKPPALAGFEVAGADHHFVAASARIDGKTVFVSSPKIAQPRYVRYAWANAPEATLFNSAGLPASTFTSEETPLVPCTQACAH
jgi:sialate O-acetylesterase